MIEKVLAWIVVFGLVAMAVVVVGLWVAGYWAAAGLIFWRDLQEFIYAATTGWG